MSSSNVTCFKKLFLFFATRESLHFIPYVCPLQTPRPLCSNSTSVLWWWLVGWYHARRGGAGPSFCSRSPLKAHLATVLSTQQDSTELTWIKGLKYRAEAEVGSGLKKNQVPTCKSRVPWCIKGKWQKHFHIPWFLLRQVCAGRGSTSTPKGCLGFMVISLLLQAETLVWTFGNNFLPLTFAPQLNYS